VFTGIRCKDMGAGATVAEIIDKILRKALIVRTLKLDMPVSFLIIPDIHRTGRAGKNQRLFSKYREANLNFYHL